MAIHRQGGAAAHGHTRLWDRFQRGLAQLRRSYEPGTLAGDFNRFLNALDRLPVPDVWLGGWEHLDRWRAAAALVRHRRFIPFWPADPQAKGHVRRMIREHGGREGADRHLREDLHPKALVLAAEGLDQPQRIRLKNGGFVKDAARRVLPFKPEDLAVNGPFYRWLRKETINHVERLLGEADSIVRPERTPRPPAFYGRRPPAEQFFGRLSTDDRALIRLRERGASYAEIGAALDISRDAAKQRAYRLDHRRR